MNPATAIRERLATMGLPHVVWEKQPGAGGPENPVFIFRAGERLCVLIAEPEDGGATDPFYYFAEKWAAQGAIIRIICTQRQLEAAFQHVERLNRIARAYDKPD